MNALSEFAPNWDQFSSQEVVGKAVTMTPRRATVTRSQATETDKEEEDQPESPPLKDMAKTMLSQKKKKKAMLGKSQSEWNLAKKGLAPLEWRPVNR